MAHSHSHLREMHPGRKRAHEMSKHFKRGGKVHSDEAEDRKLFNKLITKHHKEEMKAEGKKSGGRLDKYARGGKTKHKGHTNVNIVVAPHGPHPSVGAAPAIPPAPPLPPGGGGPAGMMPPPGAGGPLPPGMPPMKRGGKIKGKYARGGKIGMTAGADSGEGRLQKARKYSAK